jgi:hypothetical protein
MCADANLQCVMLMPRLSHVCFLLKAATSSRRLRKSESFFICNTAEILRRNPEDMA